VFQRLLGLSYHRRNGMLNGQENEIPHLMRINLITVRQWRLAGFGKFCVKEKRERNGRNPATGEDMKLAAKRVVTFKCSGRLRDKINKSQ
jgi:nucleoid DNA-binding protein